ncbi:DUF4136 domain-containing protein [Psychroflexus planctonicus]|uniref:DUF4136 domain-containing protein n=1 Tax=Psychroflexus planctonicus TaxID=1526575 RepID=A0ABQ1SIG5_9FLAO|nr:DUF4136 domain-containing protein [Psychroflexus planctonicus]GGE37433.1 hypothetical protein GCM10010832_17060 [Psychroflexus planctonicus]
MLKKVNSNKIVFLLAVASLLFACSAPIAYVDYDEQVNFDEYTSYNFFAPETILNVAEEDTIMGFIENNLQAKGIESKVISKFSVDFYVDFFDVENPIVTSEGYAMFNNDVPYMALTISFADALTSELFWQAVVERRVPRYMSKEERIEYYKELVKTALEKYPPKPEDSPNAKEEESPQEKADQDAKTSNQ